MSKVTFQQIALSHLGSVGLLKEPGGLLYSSHETLKPGDVYLLGLNPGGADGKPISAAVEGLLEKKTNDFLHDRWKNKIKAYDAGEAPLQKRVKWLLEQLVGNASDVCASNLIFVQSQSAKDIHFFELADKCWRVHEEILKIVKPKLILCFGNSAISPYGYLSSRFPGNEEILSSGHGNWVVKGYQASINGRPVYVAGVPHLSYYSPMGKSKEKEHVIDWLRQKLK